MSASQRYKPRSSGGRSEVAYRTPSYGRGRSAAPVKYSKIIEQEKTLCNNEDSGVDIYRRTRGLRKPTSLDCRPTTGSLENRRDKYCAEKLAEKSQMAYEAIGHKDLNELLLNICCPTCSSTVTSKVELDERKKNKRHDSDEELAVRYCYQCGNCYGADDSVDMNHAQKRYEDCWRTAKSDVVGLYKSDGNTRFSSAPDSKDHYEFRPTFCTENSDDGRRDTDGTQKIAEKSLTIDRAYESLSKEELNKRLANTPCPTCSSTITSKVELDERKKNKRHESDDELAVRYCHRCGDCFGADDSMDAEDLQRLFEENKVTVKPTKICKCGNDDVYKFTILSIDESTGQPVVQCQLCSAPLMLESVEYDDDEDCSFLVSDREMPDFEYQQASSLVCKGCGISEVGIFDRNYDARGRLKTFRCLRCDCKNDVSACNQFRRVPGNEYREHDQINSNTKTCELLASCRNRRPKNNYNPRMRSDAPLPTPKLGQPIRTRRRKVTSLDEVNVGDHVAWHRDYVIWHHAIVTKVKSSERKITVVNYNGGLKKHEGHFASVREEDVKVDLKKKRMYVYDYFGCSFNPADVVARARSRLGESCYNMILRNCEHFAHWCITGMEYSKQVKSFFVRLGKTCETATSSLIRETMVSTSHMLEGISAKHVWKIGYRSGLNRLKGSFGGVGSFAVVRGVAIAFDIFSNLAMEAGLFAYSAYKAYRKYKSNEITKSEFKRELCQSGSECTGGFLGAVGGGFLGQLLIPIPFLGGLIGSTVGSLIGRFLGAMFGKKISDKFIDKK